MNRFSFSLTCSGLVALAGFSAQGATLVGETFLSTNGAVSFFEYQDGPDVTYYVDVIGDLSISGVAFSFEADTSVSPPPLLGLEPGPPSIPAFGPGSEFDSDFFGFSILESWSTVFLSAAEWDQGVGIVIAGQGVMTNALGTFVELFGTEDNHVVVYLNESGAPISESNDVDGVPSDMSVPHFFRGEGTVSTEGLFFDNSGGVVAQTIPEPSVISLAALALLGLGWRRRA